VSSDEEIATRAETGGGTGTLYLVSTPIGNLGDMTFRAVEVLSSAALIIAEDTRHSRRLLDHFEIETPVRSYHEHNEARETPRLIARLEAGDSIALISDAGTPLISDPGSRLVQAVIERGARVVSGGARENGFPTPLYWQATILDGVSADAEVAREETFGPVAPIVPVASLDEAIALANGTRFGLGANVYTRDLETAVRCLREIRAGTVWINDPLTDNDAGPFGGFKQSGFGRELGQEGLEAFQETKHVHIETEIAPKEWWYPYGE